MRWFAPVLPQWSPAAGRVHLSRDENCSERRDDVAGRAGRARVVPKPAGRPARAPDPWRQLPHGPDWVGPKRERSNSAASSADHMRGGRIARKRTWSIRRHTPPTPRWSAAVVAPTRVRPARRSATRRHRRAPAESDAQPPRSSTAQAEKSAASLAGCGGAAVGYATNKPPLKGLPGRCKGYHALLKAVSVAGVAGNERQITRIAFIKIQGRQIIADNVWRLPDPAP